MSRKKITLPEHVRAAALADLEAMYREWQEQIRGESFKLRVYLALEQGLLQGEVGQRCGVGQTQVSNWKVAGEQIARNRGLVGDPDRPGEREQVA